MQITFTSDCQSRVPSFPQFGDFVLKCFGDLIFLLKSSCVSDCWQDWSTCTGRKMPPSKCHNWPDTSDSHHGLFGPVPQVMIAHGFCADDEMTRKLKETAFNTDWSWGTFCVHAVSPSLIGHNQKRVLN